MIFTGDDAGQSEDGASRGAQGLLVVRADGAGQDDVSGGSEGLGRADEGTEISGVLQAGGDKDEWLRASEDLIEGEGRRMDEGGDSLRRLSMDGACEYLRRQSQNFCGLRYFEAVEENFAAGLDEDSIEFEAAGGGFLQQMFTLNREQAALSSGGAREGGAQFFYPRILPTLYNAYVVRAVKSGGHGCDSKSFL